MVCHVFHSKPSNNMSRDASCRGQLGLPYGPSYSGSLACRPPWLTQLCPRPRPTQLVFHSTLVYNCERIDDIVIVNLTELAICVLCPSITISYFVVDVKPYRTNFVNSGRLINLPRSYNRSWHFVVIIVWRQKNPYSMKTGRGKRQFFF